MSTTDHPVIFFNKSKVRSAEDYLDFPNTERSAVLRDILEDIAVGVVGTAAPIVLHRINRTL